MAKTGYVTAELFAFFRELTENNDRDWFQANKKRYEALIKEPLQAFIAAASGPLAEISPHLVADPRRSMFRIYRDVRFSKDKSPYKTQAAIQFRHVAGKDAHAPGFYVHLAPDEVFFGAGSWRPAGPSLLKIREAIVERPDDWRAALADEAFASSWSLAGESLKRPPRGFDKDHPLVEDLKRKDFIAMKNASEEEVCRPDFLPRLMADFRTASPFMRFLTSALGVAW